MSAKRNRAGLLAHIIAANDHDHCMALRSAWADTHEIELFHVIVRGVIPGAMTENLFSHFLKKRIESVKRIRILKNGLLVTVITKDAADRLIALLDGKDLSREMRRPFSKEKLRAYFVPPKEGIDDIDFSTRDKFVVRSIHDDQFFVKYIIAGNGDMIFAYRQRSDRDRNRPDLKSWSGDHDFWTLVYVYENGMIGKTETGVFETELLVKQLEFKAGKEPSLTRKNVREVTYRVIENGKSRDIPASLLGEIEYRSQYRFGRASDNAEDRSTLKGWGNRPGQWSAEKGGTLNDQFLAERLARELGFLDPDTRTIEQTHGKTVGFVTGTKVSAKKSIEQSYERDSIEDLANPAKVAAELRIQKMIKDSQTPISEPARLKSAPNKIPAQKPTGFRESTDPKKIEAAKARFFAPSKNETGVVHKPAQGAVRKYKVDLGAPPAAYPESPDMNDLMLELTKSLGL